MSGQGDHPITEMIWSALAPGRRGTASLSVSAEGERAIRAEMFRAIADGDIGACLASTATVIGFLSARDEARDAVVVLARLYREAAPELDESAKLKAAAMHGEKPVRRAEMLGAPAPKGSIKNRDLRPIPAIIR